MPADSPTLLNVEQDEQTGLHFIELQGQAEKCADLRGEVTCQPVRSYQHEKVHVYTKYK